MSSVSLPNNESIAYDAHEAGMTASSRGLLLMLLTFVLPLISLVGVFAITGSSQEALLCAAGVMAFAACVWPALAGGGRLDLFHPFMLVGLSVLLGTTGRAFYICLYHSPGVTRLLENDRPGDILPGGLLILIGTIAMAAGYLAAGKMRTSGRLSNWLAGREFNEKRLRVLTVVVLILTALLTVDMLRKTGGFSFSSLHDLSRKRKAELSSNDTNQKYASLGYHNLVCRTLPAAVYYVWLAIWIARRRPAKWLPWLVFLGIAACAYPFLTSSRVSVLYVMINTTILLYLTRQVSVRGILVTVVASVVCLTVMKGLRDSSFDEGRFSDVSVADAVFGQRNLCGVVKTANLYEALGTRLEYHYGSTLFRWVIAPVPRRIWPAKPAVSLGYSLTEKVYGRDTDKGGGTPPGFVGEMLMNFGVAGVPIGCFAFGALIAVFYNNFKGGQGLPTTVLLLYVTLLMPIGFHIISGEVSRTIISIITTVACLLTIVLLASVPKSPQQAPVQQVPVHQVPV